MMQEWRQSSRLGPNHRAALNDAMLMPTRKLEIRCARVAARAGEFLASARAIIEPEIAYFVELRERLNAQGRRGGIEGWQRWCERHFSCDVRTDNRALSSILGPEKERKKTRNWRAQPKPCWKPSIRRFGLPEGISTKTQMPPSS